MGKKIASLFVLVTLLVTLVGVIPVASQDGDRPSDADWSPEALTPPTAPVEEKPSFVAKPLEGGTVIQVDKNKDKEAVRSSTDAVLDPSQLEVVPIIVTFEEGFNPATLEVASGSKIVHRYEKVFNGASLVVAGDKVEGLAALPGVKKVYLDKVEQPMTDSSPEFVGATTVWADMGGQEYAGEGVIVGVLDTGIWPEHPSFSDPDPNGKPYSAPPGGPYDCDFGNTAFNPNDAPFTCNNKLIGAYTFLDTYKIAAGLPATDFDSARDSDGHGTHTTSTSAGNGWVEAEIYGIPKGTISGMAPRAHVIAYKVCGPEGCYHSDSAAAVEQAIIDGVDAINFSIGGGANPYSDAVSNAFLAAFENGVFVSCSSGNSGPGLDTTDHREPWTTTVGASYQDRWFMGELYVHANGSELTLDGVSVTPDYTGTHEVVFASDVDAGNSNCAAPFPAATWTNGEIVVCDYSSGARIGKSYNVMVGGAGGMVMYNPYPKDMMSDNHWVPSIQLDHVAGQALLDFRDAVSPTTIYGEIYGGTATDTGNGDIMTRFSSRGGPAQTLGLSKPDVTAPGIQILAGNTPVDHADRPALFIGPPGQWFQAIAGTSMSSPHVAGAGALLKSQHPDWTPGMIKSALMTTAWQDVNKFDSPDMADAFDYGSGRIDLSKAGNTTFFMSDTGANFVALADNLWDANLPAAYFPIMPGRVTFYRTAFISQHKESPDAYWHWWTETPSDVNVKVTLDNVQKGFDGDRLTFKFVVTAKNVPLGEVRFAHVYFEHNLNGELHHFPITLVRGQWPVTLDKECTPQNFPLGAQTECTITVANNTFDPIRVSVVDKLPDRLEIVPGSVIGGKEIDAHKLRKIKTLYPQSPPLVDVVDGTGTTPAGYLPASLFDVPLAGHDDESYQNFDVPDFVYAGKTWNRICIVSDGYAVVGGCSGSADVDFINQVLPDDTPPNNVLAPFWTDLDPSKCGLSGPDCGLYAVILTDGVNDWLVLDWEDVPTWSYDETDWFQIWIGFNGVEDISFTYGPVGDGDGGWLTVGAENEYGNEGDNWYADGTGTLVVQDDELRVTSIPGDPGESHTITFLAEGVDTGGWNNCANMTSADLYGVTIDCFGGKVRPVP